MMRLLLCPFKGSWPKMDCVKGECSKCADLMRPFSHQCVDIFFQQVTWSHWERIEVEGRKKLDVVQKSGEVSDMLEELNSDLTEPVKGRSYCQHLFTAFWQKAMYDNCRNFLKPGQVMLLQDFAENRKATYSGEVKSAHFGKQQVTLHPTVCFFTGSDGQLVRHVHMFFSNDIGHDFHAVHQFTLKSIELLRRETEVKEVIVWSDGAGSQYKGRGNFADATLMDVPFQRHYFGSDHGKREADGETGRFAQHLRRAVAKGQSFRNAEDMAAFGASVYPTASDIKKYLFIVVHRDEIIRERPEVDVGTLPGTRSLHQVVALRPYCLKARKLSCFCTACVEEQGTCAWQDIVSPFETFKMKPSIPLNEAFAEDPDPPQEEEPEQQEPVFSTSKIPTVGEWLQLKGRVAQKKGKPPKELLFYAVVQNSPTLTDFFFVEFLKRTAVGTYAFQDVVDVSVIIPGEPCHYEWRVVPTPKLITRPGSSRTDSLACQYLF